MEIDFFVKSIEKSDKIYYNTCNIIKSGIDFIPEQIPVKWGITKKNKRRV